MGPVVRALLCLAQIVREEFRFPREEFRMSARPDRAGSEALASVEITLILVLSARVLRTVNRNTSRRNTTTVGILRKFSSMLIQLF